MDSSPKGVYSVSSDPSVLKRKPMDPSYRVPTYFKLVYAPYGPKAIGYMHKDYAMMENKKDTAFPKALVLR